MNRLITAATIGGLPLSRGQMLTLKQMREAKKLRQEEVAAATGFSYAHIVNLEKRGQTNPSFDAVSKLAAIYGRSEREVRDALRAAAAKPSAPVLPGVGTLPAFVAAGR